TAAAVAFPLQQDHHSSWRSIAAVEEKNYRYYRGEALITVADPLQQNREAECLFKLEFWDFHLIFLRHKL
ncbi:hypothetical protein HAX54_030445, partial [Datura stramonium]|nr:hypothetical protein [Datura stramonium]